MVALEATGGFETVAAAALAAAGLPVVVVNPAQIRAFAKAIGQRAKTDPIDAAVIAHFAEATKPEPRPLPDEATRLLADLVARRRQIIEMIGAERQREKRATARLKKSIARLVKALEKELASVDCDIDDAVRGSPAWREKEDLLASVPGVGPIIARTLIAELPELGQPRPQEDRSARRPCPIHPPVRPMARPKLHRRRTKRPSEPPSSWAPWSPRRHNPILKAFFDRLVAAGKPKMVALIAVARKLLTILNAILRDQQPWQTA